MAGVVSDTVNMTVKMTKAEYEAKIAELEGYNKLLNSHLQTLEDMRDQIPGFWGSTDGANAVKQISSVIQKVKNASNKIDTLNMNYMTTVEELTKQQQQNEAAFSNIDALLGKLSDN